MYRRKTPRPHEKKSTEMGERKIKKPIKKHTHHAV